MSGSTAGGHPAQVTSESKKQNKKNSEWWGEREVGKEMKENEEERSKKREAWEEIKRKRRDVVEL